MSMREMWTDEMIETVGDLQRRLEDAVEEIIIIKGQFWECDSERAFWKR